MSPVLETGRYEILENLGCGAACRVDKARDTVIGRTVALKTFLQGFGKNSEQQFLLEAQTVGRLSHTSIAQLYGVALLTGVGFTMSLFIGTLAFEDENLMSQVRVGVLAASILAGVVASVVLSLIARAAPAGANDIAKAMQT